MFTLPIRSFRWSVENARAIGVAGALVSVLYLKARADQQPDIFGVLSIVLPVLEVTMFAAILAIYRDSVANAEDRLKGLGAMAVWFAVCFAIMWLNVAFVRAGIDAYVRLGAPPAFDFGV
jgi:small ligand-binding sensory domain FIST